jgi:hypothetical protein
MIQHGVLFPPRVCNLENKNVSNYAFDYDEDYCPLCLITDAV